MDNVYEIKLKPDTNIIHVVNGEYYTIKDGWLNVYIWEEEFDEVAVFSAHASDVEFIGIVDK